MEIVDAKTKDERRLEKNRRIAEAGRGTRERHAAMDCVVVQLKITKNRLNAAQKEFLRNVFLEAKWLRNDVVANIDDADYKKKSVPVKVGDHFKERPITTLGSHLKQGVIEQVKRDIKALACAKREGCKVGALKFVSFVNSVDLKQYGVTYSIDADKNTVHIQGMKRPFKVRGMKQFKKIAEKRGATDIDFANAKLVRKPSGYYIHVTCYLPEKAHEPTGRTVGADFGIAHNLNLSDGTKIDASVPEARSVKIASRRLHRALARGGNKSSGRHRKRQWRLRRSYEHMTNKKDDLANKIVHTLVTENDLVAIQDEMLHNWHAGLFGRQVQHSVMGRVKAKLKDDPLVVAVPRPFASTQVCPVCGMKTKHPLSVRSYTCAHCGYTHPDRDTKSALSILDKALEMINAKTLCGTQSESPVEARAAALHGVSMPGKPAPVKREARHFNAG